MLFNKWPNTCDRLSPAFFRGADSTTWTSSTWWLEDTRLMAAGATWTWCLRCWCQLLEALWRLSCRGQPPFSFRLPNTLCVSCSRTFLQPIELLTHVFASTHKNCQPRFLSPKTLEQLLFSLLLSLSFVTLFPTSGLILPDGKLSVSLCHELNSEVVRICQTSRWRSNPESFCSTDVHLICWCSIRLKLSN